MSPTSIDPEKTTVPIKVLVSVAVTLLAMTIPAAWALSQFRADVENAFEKIRETISRDAVLHEKDREAIVQSIREVRDELRMMQHDSVSVRQAQTWIEMFRAANKTLQPQLEVPDLPR
jgi:membrane-bound lytic murein transglycosylase B